MDADGDSQAAVLRSKIARRTQNIPLIVINERNSPARTRDRAAACLDFIDIQLSERRAGDKFTRARQRGGASPLLPFEERIVFFNTERFQVSLLHFFGIERWRVPEFQGGSFRSFPIRFGYAPPL